jgi:chromosome segregation ATPase
MSRTNLARIVQPEQIEEAPVEARLAVLETDVAYIKKDIGEMKTDIRELRGDMKAANESIADVRSEMHSGFGELRTEMANLRTETHKDLGVLRSEIGNLRAEMHAGFGELRTEMRERYEQLRGSQRLGVAVNTIGQLLTAGSVLGVVAKAQGWL